MKKSTQSLTAYQLVVSLYLLMKAISRLNLPLIRDEAVVAVWLPQESLLGVLNPFADANHPGRTHVVANFSSWISIKLFGISAVSLRLPSILFTAVFLGVLFLYTRRFQSKFLVLLIYSHLVVNEVFQWYTAYHRGYISLLAFSLLALWATEGWLFVIAIFLCAASAGLGSAFVFIVALSLLLWKRLDGKRLWVAAGFVTIMANACYTFFLERFLTQPQWRFPGMKELFLMFGYSYEDAGPFLAVLLLGAGLWIWRAWKRDLDFPSVVVGVSVAVMLPATLLFADTDVRGRYFLVFLIPVLLCLALSADRIPQRRWRWSVQVALLCLMVIPPVVARPAEPTPMTKELKAQWDRVRGLAPC